MTDRSARVSLLVDSDPAYGCGHLSRCLLLAEALAEQGASCRFLLTKLVEMPGLAKFPFALLGSAAPEPGDIVVVDGYRFEPAFLERLKVGSPRLVVIDDLGGRVFPAHAILNHNIYAESLDYSQHPETELFLGPRYGLVRPEFFRLRNVARQGDNILVTLGGSPLAGIGVEIAVALHRHLNIDVEAVVGAGASFPDFEEGIHIHRWADLAQLVKNASLVVCGLGVTFLEVLASGRSVIGVQIATNQALAYRAAKEAGYPVFERIDANEIAVAAADVICGRMAEPACPFQLDPQGATRAAAAVLGKKD